MRLSNYCDFSLFQVLYFPGSGIHILSHLTCPSGLVPTHLPLTPCSIVQGLMSRVVIVTQHLMIQLSPELFRASR